jgi:hypothetical protein
MCAVARQARENVTNRSVCKEHNHKQTVNGGALPKIRPTSETMRDRRQFIGGSDARIMAEYHYLPNPCLPWLDARLYKVTETDVMRTGPVGDGCFAQRPDGAVVQYVACH